MPSYQSGSYHLESNHTKKRTVEEEIIMSTEKDNKLAMFKGKRIRKILHEGEWWFVVEDVVLALIESRDPKQYIQRMKQRDPELGKGWVQIVRTLPIATSGGPQNLNCANTEGIFRLIQSIPKVDEYKQVKDLERENLRDHMTDIELILTMLAEATTTKLHRDRDSLGMKPLKKDAKDGGAVVGIALLDHIIFNQKGYYSFLEKGLM